MAQDRFVKAVRKYTEKLDQACTEYEQGVAPTNGVADLKMTDEATSESVGTVKANANGTAQELIARGKNLTKADLDAAKLTPDLKAVCKSLGLTQTGKKEDVIKKILKHYHPTESD